MASRDPGLHASSSRRVPRAGREAQRLLCLLLPSTGLPSFLHSFMCCVTLSRSLALSVLVRTCKGGADQDARLTGLTPAQRRG